MRTADFDFELPPELIAQAPAPQRDLSRLLVLHRHSNQVEHRRFRDLQEYLRPGDVLVLNNSRVIPARLCGMNAHTDGRFEILLLEENAANDWWVMLRPGKRARVGTKIILRDKAGHPTEVCATVLETNPEGHRRLRFGGAINIADLLDRLGEVPLPPYIVRTDSSQMEPGPPAIPNRLCSASRLGRGPNRWLAFHRIVASRNCRSRRAGLLCHLACWVRNLRTGEGRNLAAHIMHEERYELSEATARAINEAKTASRRVIAVGTTTVRVLESVAAQAAQRSTSPRHLSSGPVVAGVGKTRIFIYPPYDFRVADALLTNFHLPRSTLLMLVSAFADPNGTRGRNAILSAYAEAIRQRYRFFSYGDAMLML